MTMRTPQRMLMALLAGAALCAAAQKPDTLIADFEGDTCGLFDRRPGTANAPGMESDSLLF
jgi:hypothetical protein